MRPSILLVDDERINLLNLQFSLNDRYTVLSEGSAEGALATLQREPVSLVVTDHRMDGMTGVQLCRRMHELDIHVPVIILTGYVDSPEIDAALAAGEISEVVVKPYVLENLIQTIDRYLSEDATTNPASR